MLGTLWGGGGGAIRSYCTRYAVVLAATAFSSPIGNILTYTDRKIWCLVLV